MRLTWNAFQLNSWQMYSGLFKKRLLKTIWAEVQNDDCLDLAAQMSFYFVLSFFPFLLVIAAIVGWLPSTGLWQSFVQWATNYLPYESRKLVFSAILDLPTGANSGFLSLGLIATVWAASSGVTSLMDSLNVVYRARETRSFWRRRAIALIVTGLAAFFFIASFGALALGRWAGDRLWFDFRWIHISLIPFEISRWAVTLLLICFALDLMDYFLPNLMRPWRWLTPGRFFAALMFAAADVGFNYYLRHFADYPKIYGALAGFVALMAWIYIASLILLVGATIDCVLLGRKEHGESV